MNTKYVRYAGYLESLSGMGNAARNISVALMKGGVGVSTEFIPNIVSASDLGETYELCRKNENKDIPYDVKFIHTTPDVVRQRMEPMKYHIFHLFWETDRLPPWWVWELNHSVDEIWTGCEWNKEVFIKSGIKIPIFVCPQPIPKTEESRPFRIPGHNGYTFLSVFQWIQRKDPKTLLTAYWKEFQRGENVGLVIKTYKERFTQEETDAICRQVRSWKKELGLIRYPKLYFIPESLTKEDINRLYVTADCVVSSHRGEGFGIPIGEAMSFGKPVISTDLGGIHEHIPKDLWYPIEYSMCPAFDMDWVLWYSRDQQWAQADEGSLRRRFREVYDHQEEAKQKGKKAKEFVERELSFEAVGKRMAQQLATIGV